LQLFELEHAKYKKFMLSYHDEFDDDNFEEKMVKTLVRTNDCWS